MYMRCISNVYDSVKKRKTSLYLYTIYNIANIIVHLIYYSKSYQLQGPAGIKGEKGERVCVGPIYINRKLVF